MPQAFIPQNLRVQRQAFVLGGNTISYRPSRDSIIRRADIVIEGTVSGAIATESADGYKALIKAVNVSGSISGLGNVTSINNLSGPDIIDYAQIKQGTLPQQVNSALANSTFFSIRFPLIFENPRFGIPELRYMSCLPANNMPDLTINVVTGSQTDIDVNATPTFAVTNATCYVESFQFVRESLPQWTYFKSVQDVREDFILSTGDYLLQLPAGGFYQAILFRAFATTSGGIGLTKQVDTTAPASSAPFNTDSGGYIRLYDLNQRVKQDVDFLDLRAENDASILDSTLVPGNAALMFNRNLNELFYTGVIANTSNNVDIKMSVRTGTNSKIRTVYERFFDDKNVLGLQ